MKNGKKFFHILFSFFFVFYGAFGYSKVAKISFQNQQTSEIKYVSVPNQNKNVPLNFKTAKNINPVLEKSAKSIFSASLLGIPFSEFNYSLHSFLYNHNFNYKSLYSNKFIKSLVLKQTFL